MISVRNVHGRGLEFGKERMVDDTELEEGEAGTLMEEKDQVIDPDVAFAYIGEKLHDLLGHHQKEFEGCFTAENLGPKYGAYGSFLPTSQRSPSSLHLVTRRVHVQENLPKKITSSLGASNNFVIPSTTRHEEQHELGCTAVSKLRSVNNDGSLIPFQVSEIKAKSEDAKQLPTILPNNINNSVEKDAVINSTCMKGIKNNSGDAKQFIKLARQKPVRLRITMNSKKLLPLNSAATIDGLGPNASLLKSNTTRGEGVSIEYQDTLTISPSDIIKYMAASPIPRSSILSPLPEYLKCLTANERQQKDYSTNDNHPMKGDWPDSKNSEKILKFKKKKSHLTDCDHEEESDRVYQMSVSAKRGVVNGNLNLDVHERDRPCFEPTQLIGQVNGEYSGTDIKYHDNGYRTFVGDDARGPVKGDMPTSGPTLIKKAAYLEQDAVKDSPIRPEGGKRSEDCSIQHKPLPYLSKGNQVDGSSMKPGKAHSSSGLNNNPKLGNMNLQRGLGKIEDSYKEIFGDFWDSSTEDEKNESADHETFSDFINKKPEVYNKKITVPIHKPKLMESHKKIKESVAVDQSTSVDFRASVPADHSNADITVAAAPVPIKDNWVYCDRCKKWRLLPLHVDTNSLPKKWMCRMMKWLPGMNQCKFSEDDTTRAVRAIYESIVPENMKVDAGVHGVASVVSTSNMELPGQTSSYISVPLAMEKKHESNKISESVELQCTAKVQQSKPSDSSTEKNRVKTSKKFLHVKGATAKRKSTENRRESYPGSPQACDVSRGGIIMSDKDQSTYKDYQPRKNLKVEKNLHQLPAKQSKAVLRVSSEDSSLETQIVVGNHLANNKRKLMECSESEQQTWVNQAPDETFIEDHEKSKKRMKPNPSGFDGFLTSKGNCTSREKVDTLNVHKSASGIGTNLSKLKNVGSLKKIAPVLSNSKLSISHKSRMEIEGMEAYPVGSSSPLCRSKKDQQVVRKRSSMRQDGMVDKSLLRKPEPLQSADKSNSSCTISGSKEDVSSVGKIRDAMNKVPVNNAVRCCERDTDVNMSSESSKLTVCYKSAAREYEADLFSSERALSNQLGEVGSQRKLLAETNQLDTASGTDKLLLGPIFNCHGDNMVYSSQDAPKLQNGYDLCTKSVAVTNDNNLNVKGPCLVMNSGNQRVIELAGTTSVTQDGHRTKDFCEQSLSTNTKDLPNEAIFIEKEARNLKYIADRLGDSGSACEKVGIYFQSALKFLSAASLYELSWSEHARLGNRNHFMHIYRSTTKLLEFCASEFEKLNNICAVALAYKCMEVACLRVVYSSHSSASKDVLDLQTVVPPGESPSPCLSVVDNLNNVASVDLASLTKDLDSPLATDGLIIPAQNRSNLIQLFTFTEDVDMAMDSSQKSWAAFMTANANSVSTRGISLVKEALDFGFQDVNQFLHLVRFAMDAISS